MKALRCFYPVCFTVLCLALAACSELSDSEVETLLKDANVYPHTVEYKMFCNSGEYVKKVVDKKLVANGYVTAQVNSTHADIGKPLIYFTEKATPYLIATDDTLKSFYIQRIRMADEVFRYVHTIEVNPAGTKAVVDYTVAIENVTPFSVLSSEAMSGEKKRRTFFSRKDKVWTWDGKIVAMPE